MFGLIGKQSGVVPVQSVRVDSQIYDLLNQVTLTQQYCATNKVRECSYSFPLDENAAVIAFQAQFGDTVIQGVCREIEEAKKEFAWSVKQGKRAALAEQRQENVFLMRIGNLEPNQVCTIQLTYLTLLDVEGPAVCACFPMYLAPRYAPTGAPPDEEKRALVAQLSLTIHVTTPRRICSIQSPSHANECNIIALDNELDAVIRLETQLLERDVLFHITQEQPHRPRILLEKQEDTQSLTAMVTIVPEVLPFEQVKKNVGEFIVLWDQSGSMKFGGSLEASQYMMQSLLKAIPPACYLNIIPFGNTFRPLWKKSRLCTPSQVKELLSKLSEFRAEMGGTEMIPPLKYAFRLPQIFVGETVVPRNIFLLTDGDVTNADHLVKLCRQNCSENLIRESTIAPCVYTIGLGSSVNRSLCKRVAKAGHGTCEFVSDAMTGKAELARKAILQLTRALQPRMTNAQIEWPFANMKTWPTRTQPLMPGERLVLYGKSNLAKNPAVPPFSDVVVRASILYGGSNVCVGTQVVEYRLPCDWSRVLHSSFVRKYAVRERIRECDERYVCAPQEEQQQLRAQITGYGKKYGLSSRFTAFLAVQQSASEDSPCMVPDSEAEDESDEPEAESDSESDEMEECCVKGRAKGRPMATKSATKSVCVSGASSKEEWPDSVKRITKSRSIVSRRQTDSDLEEEESEEESSEADLDQAEASSESDTDEEGSEPDVDQEYRNEPSKGKSASRSGSPAARIHQLRGNVRSTEACDHVYQMEEKSATLERVHSPEAKQDSQNPNVTLSPKIWISRITTWLEQRAKWKAVDTRLIWETLVAHQDIHGRFALSKAIYDVLLPLRLTFFATEITESNQPLMFENIERHYPHLSKDHYPTFLVTCVLLFLVSNSAFSAYKKDFAIVNAKLAMYRNFAGNLLSKDMITHVQMNV